MFCFCPFHTVFSCFIFWEINISLQINKACASRLYKHNKELPESGWNCPDCCKHIREVARWIVFPFPPRHQLLRCSRFRLSRSASYDYQKWCTFAGYPVQPSTTLSAAMPSLSRYPWVEKMWPGYSRRSVHGWRRELLPASKEAMRETGFAVSSPFFWLASWYLFQV